MPLCRPVFAFGPLQFLSDAQDCFAGTFFPSFLALESPIAIACFGFVTFLPLRPDLSVPRFISFISVSMFSLADGEYLRPEVFFAAVFFALLFFVAILHLLDNQMAGRGNAVVQGRDRRECTSNDVRSAFTGDTGLRLSILDDGCERIGFEAGATDECAINLFLAKKSGGIVGLDAAPVEDTHL